MTTPGNAVADGTLASVRITIAAQFQGLPYEQTINFEGSTVIDWWMYFFEPYVQDSSLAVAYGFLAAILRSDSVSTSPAIAIAQGLTACILRTDMPAAPRVSVTLSLGISAVNSTQRIEAV